MVSNYSLGSLKLKSRFFLAPMLEPNDIAFRMLCKQAGAGLTYTGMTNPLSKQKIHFDDRPALQLFCYDTKGLKEFINKYDSKVSLWDLNLGCPSKLAGKMGFGSFLQENPEIIEKILRVMRESTKKPITIKLRKSKQAISIAQMAEKIGIDAIGIHPRTKEQGYMGLPDIEFAKEMKKSLNIPIIYSGDFERLSKENQKAVLDNFDFIFIGRGAIGNPGIFSELIGDENKINFGDYLKLAKKYHIFFRTIKMQAMHFTKNMESARKLRGSLIYAKSLEEIEKVYNEKNAS